MSRLEAAAWDAQGRAHAPYSGFAVGAAIESTDGEIVNGCNLENASLGLGLCAERVALFRLVALGKEPGAHLVIVTDTQDPTPPCGACREVLRALAPNTTVTSVAASGARMDWAPGALLPAPAPRGAGSGLEPRAFIADKRDGRELSEEQIHGIIQGLLQGEVEPYQMTAFMMAVCWRGMNRRETSDLTRAMLSSGARLDLSAVPGPKLDKHSTGGVGDKISIPLFPLALAAGLNVPMISGRGLGHTGGTLDKLEAIPGYRTHLPVSGLEELVRDAGGFIAGQTGELVPADRIMYSLRDVSATIESVPLIVSSILSKKLAAGLTGLVLDVKFGRGAFMPDRNHAERLARVLVDVAGDMNLPALALLTRMDDPIGFEIGNALEVIESLRLLTEEEAAEDLRQLTLALGGLMVALAGKAGTMREGAERLERLRRGGEAAEAARKWIAAQGGDPRVVSAPDRLEISDIKRTIRAPADGWVIGVDARRIGQLGVRLGGGRARVKDPIDRRVGIRLHRKRGDRVEAGDPLCTFLLPAGSSPDRPVKGEEELYEIGPEAPMPVDVIVALVTPTGVFEDPWDVPITPAIST